VNHEQAIEIRTRQLTGKPVEPDVAAEALRVIQGVTAKKRTARRRKQKPLPVFLGVQLSRSECPRPLKPSAREYSVARRMAKLEGKP
jgi:hypothetical protein